MQSAIITHLPDTMALIMIYLLPHVHFHGNSLCICKEIMLPLPGHQQRQTIYHLETQRQEGEKWMCGLFWPKMLFWVRSLLRNFLLETEICPLVLSFHFFFFSLLLSHLVGKTFKTKGDMNASWDLWSSGCQHKKFEIQLWVGVVCLKECLATFKSPFKRQ